MASGNPGKYAWVKPFCLQSVIRTLAFYTVGSLAELMLMTAIVSKETMVTFGLAQDLLSKMGILLLASLLFGFSFVFFHLHVLPKAARRFLHMLVMFSPVVLISQSLLVVNTSMKAQDITGYYFFALLVYLIVYGISMLIASICRRKHFLFK